MARPHPQIEDADTAAAASFDAAELAPEDFYFDGPYMVFTAAYHRRRGFCCNSGCRHCPYSEPTDTTPR